MPFIETSGKRILFIHIPKTGGTSIEKAMEKIAPLRLCIRTIPGFLKVPPEHFTLHNIDALFDEGYFDFMFSVVRNPYARLESEYRMRSILAQERFFKELPRFPIWVEQAIESVTRDRNYMANHLRPQADFVGNDVHVYKYEENLENILGKVTRKIGLQLKLPEKKLLETQHVKIPIKWSSECIRLVNTFYEEDFNAFNYKKNQYQFHMG